MNPSHSRVVSCRILLNFLKYLHHVNMWARSNHFPCFPKAQNIFCLPHKKRSLSQQNATTRNNCVFVWSLVQCDQTRSWHVFIDQGPVSRKPRKLFEPVKPFCSSSVSKNGDVYTPETSCMKGTAVHIKNRWIKQLCNRKFGDFAMVFQARKVSGAFEKRAPEH